MRIKFFLIMTVSFVVSACATFNKQTDTQQNQFEKIESGNYQMNFNYAYPFRMQPMSLSFGYNLKISNDSAYVYLPYYGVTHSAPFDLADGGIKFAAPMQDYKLTYKKQECKVTFRVRNNANDLQFNIQAYPNGKVTLYVRDSSRDPISFNGELE